MSVSSPQEPIIEDGLVNNLTYTDQQVIGYSDPNSELLQDPATLLPMFCSPFLFLLCKDYQIYFDTKP